MRGWKGRRKSWGWYLIYDAIVGSPNAAAARRAFNSLSGEIHASLKSIMIEDSRFIREAVSDEHDKP